MLFRYNVSFIKPARPPASSIYTIYKLVNIKYAYVYLTCKYTYSSVNEQLYLSDLYSFIGSNCDMNIQEKKYNVKIQ